MRAMWPAALGAALGALVSLRTLAAFTDLVWFDVDPVLDPTPFQGLGPAGSLRIDAGIAAISAALVLSFAGRAASLLAAGALVVTLARLHSESALGSLGWRGFDWIAAWSACAAAVAVARNPRQQARLAWSALVAVMLGVCCAWLVRGAWQWFHEHPGTVAFFTGQVRDDFLADRGWNPEGPQALAYMRRLAQREMTGWFGLSNIFSGVLAIAAVALAGVPRARGRDGLSWGVLSAACAVAVVANGGKGAMVALAIGYALVALLRFRRVAPLALACLSLGLLALAFAAPVLRVGAGGDLLGNERSLLFRAMYLDTAWAAFRESPWIGTGPDGFQDASARLRPLGAVEIVRSAHSAFADWPAQLGAGGLAWVAASIALIAWSARGAALERAPLEAPPARDGAPQRLVMVAVLGALVSSLLVEAASLDPMGLLVRVVGGAAWVGAAVTLLPRLWSARSCGARMLFPAALAGLCHAQVEMTLWNPGSVAWVLVTMGAAIPPHALDAARTHAERPPRLAPRVAGASACALVAVACLLRSAGEARVERTLEGAAMRLVADSSGSSGIAPAEARRDAARTLETVSRTLAVAQWLRAAEIAGPSRPEGLADLAAATRVADEAVSAGSGRVAASRLDALHAAAHAWETRALASGSDDDRRAALECALAVTRFDEGSPAGWLRAARQAAALDMPIAAALAAEALSHDSLMALDPLMRLPARDRALAERLARVSSRSPSGSP